MLTTAIQKAISSNSTIAASLAKWDFGTGSVEPAVFTTEPAPEACHNPIIVVVQTGGYNEDARGRRKEFIDHVIKVWGDRTGSDLALRTLARQVKNLLHRASLTVEGAKKHFSIASVPSRLTDPDGYPGYTITVNSLVIY